MEMKKPKTQIKLIEVDDTTAVASLELDLSEVLSDSYTNEIRPYPIHWAQRPYPISEQIQDMDNREIIELILKHLDR